MRQPAPPIRACLDWYIRMTGATATESTRDQIIHAAADSLLENGYSGTSVRSIASKAGVEGLVRVLAHELRGHQVSVNAVAPGPVATELFLKGTEPRNTDTWYGRYTYNP